MGTTLTSLQNDAGVSPVWVLCIEGVDYLLCSSDASAVETAWAATDWSTAYAGLRFNGDFAQKMTPWESKLDVSTMNFEIVDTDGNDTFAEEVFAGGAGDETFLFSDLDPNDTTVEALNAHSGFAASGDIYLGLERITYSGKSAGSPDTFTGLTRGKYAPFATASGTANRWGRNHFIPEIEYDVGIRPRITDAPRRWTGKWVGLWLHRNQGGTLDTKAQAHLAWAGRIASITDTSNQTTVISCEDVRSQLRDTTLLNDQYQGRFQEGIYIRAGTQFWAKEYYNYSNSDVHVKNELDNDHSYNLDVVVSGASGNYQVNEGYYTGEEIMNFIGNWLQQAEADSELDQSWSAGVTRNADYPNNVYVRADRTVANSADLRIHFGCSRRRVLEALGYENIDDDGYIKTSEDSNDAAIVTASQPPARYILASWGGWVEAPSKLTLSGERGTWVDNTLWFPAKLYNETQWSGTPGSDDWGVLQFTPGPLALVHRSAANTFDHIGIIPWLNGMSEHAKEWKQHCLIREGEDGHLEVKQVVFLGRSLVDIIAGLFATTGANLYNHGTYDIGAFGAQLGAAIPWELLGDPFLNSLKAANQASNQGGLCIILDKPTKMWEALESDLVLRGMYLVWKDGTLRWAIPQSPNADLSLHTLNEATKASALPGDAQRSPAQLTREFLRNSFKVLYNRKLGGGEEYRDTFVAKFAASISDYGMSAPITIKAKNSYSAFIQTGHTVEEAAQDMIATMAPIWGRPFYRVKRTIDLSLYEDVAPGDLAVLTDNFVRDPADGTRGVTSKPCLILEHRHSFGGSGADMHGDVTVLFWELDNAANYSPSALLDNTGGSNYSADTPSAGQSTITVDAHEYTHSTEDADATFFDVDDELCIFQADSNNTSCYLVTVVSQAGNNIVLDANLAGIGSNYYHVVSQDYGTADATQRSECYQADDGDGQVNDARAPYEYCQALHDPVFLFGVDVTEPPQLTSDLMYGDSAPMASVYHAVAARNANNLIHYRTAPCMPLALSSTYSAATTTSWTVVQCAPYYVGQGDPIPGFYRYVNLAPMFKSTGGDTVRVRVTFSKWPPSSGALTGLTYVEPYEQKTFTTASTSLQISTSQSALAIALELGGWGWITAEVNGENSETITYWGLMEFWTLPMQAM
jgi:hypothetical protein